MNKLLGAAVATGMVCSAAFVGEGFATAETALIVPGTAPAASGKLKTLYHFNPDTKPQIAQNYYDSDGATREVVPYPGQLWPVTGKDTLPLGQSVDVGTNNLDSMIRDTDGPIAVAGLSQGTLALNAEQARLASDPNAPAPDQLTFIKAGDPDNLFTKYFKAGTTLPVLNYTVPTPVESQYNTTEVVGQYDIFSDPLDRPGNILALANAIMAGGTNHTALAFTDPTKVAPQNISSSTNSLGATTTTYFIPAQTLPLVKVMQDAGAINQKTADELNVALRPMIDRAYGPAPAPVIPALNNNQGNSQGNNQQAPTLVNQINQIANIPNNVKVATNAVGVASNTSGAISNAVGTLRLLSTLSKLLPGKK